MNIIHGKTDCSPDTIGYDASRLDAVNAFFARFMEEKVIHGVSYCLARRGKVFASAALGIRHYKKPDFFLQPDSIFGITSVTKTFTSAAIQILVEDGLLSADDKVAKYLPQFDGAPYDQITLFHLLTHTSGLHPDPGIFPDMMHHVNCYEHIAEQIEKDGMDADWISAGLRAGVYCEPEKRWMISSFGISVLGAVIEEVTGVKAADFIIERICKPLGMIDTAFNLTPDMANRAVIYSELDEQRIKAAGREKSFDDSIWDAITAPSSGLFSTTSDLIRLGIMLQQGGVYNGTRVLGRKAVEKMTKKMISVADYCWGTGGVERPCAPGGLLFRNLPGSLASSETCASQGTGEIILIVDPVEELVCACYYPWTIREIGISDGKGEKGFNADCHNRLFNVIWSGII
jgi:CubicO group peptidase (beta-lactamase class C family)